MHWCGLNFNVSDPGSSYCYNTNKEYKHSPLFGTDIVDYKIRIFPLHAAIICVVSATIQRLLKPLGVASPFVGHIAHEERAFVLKFSAMEIYNEVVRDLLSGDGTPLRVLDDAEKGTMVERLTEETLRDHDHLRNLLSVCEAQRQIGETLLNEASSRSHQILRLTIESSAREFLGKENSSTLAATVNFVDLAGSERASQALSAGTRLKEGCHINRSLLTLGTVIRKLSSKGRNGHVPYRDSKLTRILQPSLGGNSRTAIICTMSPARSHVEQSRNTLFFASCAKEVATNARVNVVMSDKALVKHLQKELARLESELRCPGPTTAKSDTAFLLREKDRHIEKMEREIKDLKKQRDLAQSRLQDLLQIVGDDRSSRKGAEFENPSRSCPISVWEDEHSVSESSVAGPDRSQIWENLRGTGEDHEDLCKEVRCIEMEESSIHNNGDSNASSPAESEGTIPLTLTGNGSVTDQRSVIYPQKGHEAMRMYSDSAYGALEQKLQDVQKTIDCLIEPYPDEPLSEAEAADLSSSRSLQVPRSRSCRTTLSIDGASLLFQEEDNSEKTPPNHSTRDFPGRPVSVRRKFSALTYAANDDRSSIVDSEQSASLDELKGESFKTSAEDDITSIHTFVAGLKEMAKLQYEEHLVDSQDQETELKVSTSVKAVKDVGLDPLHDPLDSPSTWSLEFMRLQRKIIELWQTCNVTLVHRTYFFLLFKGDLTDRIYMEVELRRLSFIKDTLSEGHHDKLAVENGNSLTPASSLRALQRERKMLSKQMRKRLSEEEREGLYQKWGVELDTKQRRLQLAQRLWTNTDDMDHVTESAGLVANLVGLLKPGQALKEMFGLSFTPRLGSQRSYRWRYSLSYLL